MTTLDITGLTHDFRGVAHADGVAWFVEGALPGERVQALISARHAQRIDAVTKSVIDNISADRVTPSCEYYSLCGGCALQHVAPSAQLLLKENLLLEQLQKLGRVTPRNVLPSLVGEPWAYRRRVRLACKWSAGNRHLALGLRERRSEAIVEINHCAVLLPSLQALIQPIRVCLSQWSKPRQLGHVELLAGDRGVAMLLRLMSEPSTADAKLLKVFAKDFNASIFLQSGDAKQDESIPTVLFCGEDAFMHYRHEPSNTSISCLPGDFVQGNAEVNVQLVDAVLEALQPAVEDSVLEAFCGLGNFTLPLARSVRSVVALEISQAMLARAGQQAQSLGLANIQWHATNLDKFSAQKFPMPTCNKILLDPPREGARDFCRSVSLNGISRMVYVSCNPGTLARDAAVLLERGLIMESIRTVDMFPQTHHIEALAVFVPDSCARQRKAISRKPVIRNSERRLRR